MDLRIDVVTGLVIGALLWQVTGQQYPNKLKDCLSLSDIFEPCGCTLSQETFDLLCASDGHTYLSLCSFNCQKILDNVKISVTHKGVCTEESMCQCPMGYDPLCGTNGATYPNECVLKCFMEKDSTIRLAYNGTCHLGDQQPLIASKRIILDQEEPENQNKKPGNCCCHSNLKRLRTRFGKNDKRYARSSCGCGCRHGRKTEAPQKPPPANLTPQPSSRLFNNNNPLPIQPRQGCPNQPQACPLTVPEQEPKKNMCVCAMLHRPVCGNNNQTYVNFCVLDCTARRDQSVEFQYWGVCGKPQKTPYGDN